MAEPTEPQSEGQPKPKDAFPDLDLVKAARPIIPLRAEEPTGLRKTEAMREVDKSISDLAMMIGTEMDGLVTPENKEEIGKLKQKMSVLVDKISRELVNL